MSTEQTKACSHIKVTGELCRGFAIKDSNFCYFHHRTRLRHENLRRALTQRRYDVATFKGQHRMMQIPGSKLWFDDLSAEVFDALQLPVLEDKESVQVALNCVARAIVTQLLSPQQAKVLLYNIQLVMNNLPGTFTVPSDHCEEDSYYTTADTEPIHPMWDPTPEEMEKYRQMVQGDINANNKTDTTAT